MAGLALIQTRAACPSQTAFRHAQQELEIGHEGSLSSLDAYVLGSIDPGISAVPCNLPGGVRRFGKLQVHSAARCAVRTAQSLICVICNAMFATHVPVFAQFQTLVLRSAL